MFRAGQILSRLLQNDNQHPPASAPQNEASMPTPFPSVEETLNHPAYPSTIWGLRPDREGRLAAAKDRGGPINIEWEIHGVGPQKIVLIMGLAGVKSSWQRQTCYFGHDRRDDYSVLILDNRGMGGSDKPVARYSTYELGRDIIEVMDHVGWTKEREINLVGISMGGMIAQEIACAIPSRLQSLSLLCTSAAVENNKSFQETIHDVIGFMVPKTEDRAISDTAHQIFVEEWLTAADEGLVPSPDTTPNCDPVPGTPDGQYLHFETNFQRFQAQEIHKRHGTGFTRKGLLCQLTAAGLHRKTPEQLRAMADAVGRDRIMIMHGTRDNLITRPNGEKLIKIIEPSVGLIVEGMGHAPIMERAVWFNELLEERLQACGKL
ncbi:Alpha/Beta hydrolase protein [Stachybotrys elegans]|uniref:Alpha/Beta hydrolase protein n=1 Tax=Stachybotrys elegans TaxID=80388 RepID=A0A8K0SPD9_9HYPO|nr:Alpha/Beta hydrolase protein [Stachybotrys elegans]